MLAPLLDSLDAVNKDSGDVIEEITGTKFETLWDNLSRENLDFQKRVLSQEKFISHKLNKQGLHLFRTVAAELSVLNKRFTYICNHGVDDVNEYYSEFLENGIIVLENKYHWFQNPDKELWDLLSMCAGIQVHHQQFRRNDLVHEAGDIQNELHTDIFQPNVKTWLYLQDVKLEHGPTYFIYGSHINDERKLRFLYEMSNLPTGHPDIRDGSFPLKDYKKWGFEEPKPVLGKAGTYLICDTSGFHSRGYAKPGTVRSTAKLHYRFNPFE